MKIINNTMLIERESIITGKKSTMELPVTLKQINMWQKGALIQTVMPQLEPHQREFLISGMTIEEQQKIFNTYE